MPGACLLPLIALALALAGPPDDPSALVARLGPARPAGREEAARALEAMGRGALPALLAAGDAPDPEARARASGSGDGIQRSLMARPTPVRLDGEGRTLAEVVRSLGEQGGFSLGAVNQGSDRPVDARDPGPMPFWEAVDRLGLKGGYFDISNPVGGYFPTLNFGGDGDFCPTTTSGPFRVKLTGLHESRDRLLIGGPWLRVDEISQRIPIRRGAKGREGRFYAGVGLMVEPRMWFTQEGPARAIEAVDDLGQSLVPPDGAGGRGAVTLFHNGGGVTAGDVEVDLAMPDRPGRAIVRLRGSVPVALQQRRPKPALDVALAGSEGKSFELDEVTLTFRSVREGPTGTVVVVDAKLNLDRAELPPGRPAALITSRLRCLSGHQVEIVDAAGVVLTGYGGGGTRPDGTGQLNLSVSKNMTKATPARFRYYGMIRAFVDVAFEFRNIPMP